MGIKDIIARLKQKSSKFKEMEEDFRLQKKLERFMEEEREKSIKKNLEEFRKQRQKQDHETTMFKGKYIFKAPVTMLKNNDKLLSLKKSRTGGGMFFK